MKRMELLQLDRVFSICESEHDLALRSTDRRAHHAFCDVQGIGDRAWGPLLLNEVPMELIRMIHAALVFTDVKTLE